MPKTPTKNRNPPFLEAPQHTHIVSNSVSLRIYSDTKPQNMKTATLQKGIILLFNGAEVVGEGTGFGVPIAKYANETFFSGSAQLQIQKHNDTIIIHKEFLMDRLKRDKFRSAKLENKQARTLIDQISLLYQNHKHAAQTILQTKQLLHKVGVTSAFIRTAPKGKVTATYTLIGNRIQVKMDFTQLCRTDLQKIFILNEQSAVTFNKYADTENQTLTDQQIGSWNTVTSQTAKLADKQNKIGFTANQVEGAILKRGRELMKNSLDWAGLDYELSPNQAQFEYEIQILEETP